jgi:hypothetical protein
MSVASSGSGTSSLAQVVERKHAHAPSDDDATTPPSQSSLAQVVERKHAHAPSDDDATTPPSQSTTSVHHDAILNNLNSALRALGGTAARPRVHATPPTSSNRFSGDGERDDHELEACSRRRLATSPVPRMPSLDDELDELAEQRRLAAASVAVSEDLLRRLNGDIEETTRLAEERQCLLRDVTAALEDKLGEMDLLGDKVRARVDVNIDLDLDLAVALTRRRASLRQVRTLDAAIASRRRHLDALEDVAIEGEHLVEEQSRKASAAIAELEWMDAELGRLSAQLVEYDARLDAKKSILRELEALEAGSKDRIQELQGQRLLMEELERHNAAALDETRRLAVEIRNLKQAKLSFDLQPALDEALAELAEVRRRMAVEAGDGAGAGASAASEMPAAETDAETETDDGREACDGAGLLKRLQLERAASAARTAEYLSAGGRRKWRSGSMKKNRTLISAVYLF